MAKSCLQTGLLVLIVGAAPALAKDVSDWDLLWQHMVDANAAQVVMLNENDLISDDLARDLARALTGLERLGAPEADGSSYPNYLDLEDQLKEIVGEEASNIHLGRSRNDLGATMNLMLMRQQVLALLDEIAAVRTTLQDIAANNFDTVMPGFTHAVQAQPTTLAHFLLAVDATFGRDADRLRETYTRLNRSPLGSGAFTTSGFRLDRERLAELLGFPALVENSYDAIMSNPADTKMELAFDLAISAVGIGRVAQYILFQYDDPAPGLLLSDSITGHSSIMPQKRNPSAVERVRLLASEVVGRGQMSALLVHNTPLYEVKDARQDHLYRSNELVAHAATMYRNFDSILQAIIVRPDLLRAQVDADYSTMTELADALKREAGVPFRVGHEVASKLTTYGRANGKRPVDLSYEEVANVYRSVTGGDLPLSRSQVAQAFDPAKFVNGRAGIGGPQPASVRRMLDGQRSAVAELRDWSESERARLASAKANLNVELARIAGQ